MLRNDSQSWFTAQTTTPISHILGFKISQLLVPCIASARLSSPKLSSVRSHPVHHTTIAFGVFYTHAMMPRAISWAMLYPSRNDLIDSLHRKVVLDGFGMLPQLTGLPGQLWIGINVRARNKRHANERTNLTSKSKSLDQEHGDTSATSYSVKWGQPIVKH